MSSIPHDNPAVSSLRSSLSKRQKTSKTDFIQQDDALDACRDARQIVRLVQCPKCSFPLQEPVTLPCGNSICKKCIPRLHPRPNISYPATPNRLLGFTCPFPSCGVDHAEGDYSVDVVLNKVTSMVRKEIEEYATSAEASEVVHQLQEKDKWSIAGLPSMRSEQVRSRVLAGGRLIATFLMAQMGELSYGSEVVYTPVSPNCAKSDLLDIAVLEHLKESTRAELDCQVCYGLFLQPFTTTCGHTFCRTCLHRVLDHSTLCPICRRQQALSPGLSPEKAPTNSIISKLLTGLCPEALTARAEAASIESCPGTQELDMPLFVCALSFPEVPTFLHIFEPRYRLMIRRAIESGNRKFGMLLHKSNREPQGSLGPVSFYEYGTLLHIEGMHLMPDGRSLIETRGVSRFRVLKYGTLDGYTIGKIETVGDIDLAAEEALEARETNPSSRNISAQDNSDAPPHHATRTSPQLPQASKIDTMSTRALFELGVAFVKKMREKSAPWLHARVFQAYGECPEDPAIFPWWFASVLPTAETEKYKLLMTDSVRQRLKICAGWIQEIEGSNWNQSSSCNVL
ncbi:hypothetical protein WAI453_008866 [Rhynchosporium graminicola]|uniref:Related to ATP-dependent protease (CrgA) n=1 Tax=Rhynchosporium graminicola TaxID=2792576 RepID=A0A1E1KIM9_9HELO|nr:related to ATP-dependent protease (CrgA) [Rhynchosporium commune]